MTTNAKPMTPEDALDPSRALVPSIQQVNEVRVQKGFWPKIRRTAARIPFARQVVSVYYSARDPETPTAAKGILLGAPADPDGRPLVTLEGVSFRHGAGPRVLSDVPFTVRNGDIIALLGANGAGKSTLCRHFIGLHRPSSGRVRIGETDAAGMTIAQIAQQVGYVFQNPGVIVFAPTMPEEQHTVPALPAENPRDFSATLSTRPSPPMSASADPDIPAKIRLPKMLTCARPPGIRPTAVSAKR